MLRAAVSIELCLNADFYVQHPFITEKVRVNTNISQNMIFSIFLSLESTNILNDDLSKKKCILKEAFRNVTLGKWASMMCMLALSTIVNKKIETIYPDTDDLYSSVFNGIIFPRPAETIDATVVDKISILWSRIGELQKKKGKFSANHFVPVVKKFYQVQSNKFELPRPAKILRLDDMGDRIKGMECSLHLYVSRIYIFWYKNVCTG